MERLYSIVGVMFILAVSAFIMAWVFNYVLDFIERIKRPLWKEQTTRLYKDLATAFEHKYEGISKIFIRLMEDNINDVKSNAWDLRDDYDKEIK